MIELALISVLPRFRRSNIGTYLLQCVKENGQIGPYDVIRVKFPVVSTLSLRQFFLKNHFTDDLILNASFDQLENNSGDDDDEQEDEEIHNDLIELQQFETFETNIIKKKQLFKNNLHNSISFDVCGDSGGRYFYDKVEDLKYNLNSSISSFSRSSNLWISLCYLPPFSLKTTIAANQNNKRSSNSISRISNTMIFGTQSTPISTTTTARKLLYDLDNNAVDELIEQANNVWKRDMLSAYRTQWSCVGRLRTEIYRLRSLLIDCEQTNEGLKRENHQLKTKILQCKFFVFEFIYLSLLFLC